MKSFFTVAAVLLSLNFMGQDILDSIAQKTCTCIDETDFSKGQDVTSQLGLCMIEIAIPYQKELKKQYKIDIAKMNSRNGKKLGELVGMRMAVTCPEKVLSIATGEDYTSPEPVVEPQQAFTKVSGVFNEMVKDQFVSIQVTDKDGRKYTFLWLDAFDNSYDLLKDTEQMKGKTVEVEYEELELFDHKISDYRRFKVLRAFKIQ